MSKQKYQLLKPVQHVLHRPDMYIGSVITEESMKRWVCEDDKVLEKVVNYNPGFLKLFDEIISNSADEHKRNSKLNSIKVEIDSKAGTISIWDNGGIPVKKHETYDGYIPEMIFSEMFSGSNFDDTEERTTVGTNGLGSVLTNIYSHEFKIETCDGSKTYSQVFEKNMSIKGTPEIKTGKRGFTRITYTPDLGRFEMDSIDNDHILQLRKRALDIAASNSGLSVEFIADGSFNTYKFKDFKEYIDFYLDEFTECFYLNNKRADIAIVSSDSGFYHKSFVNSVDTFGGGTHIKQLENQVIEYTREYIKKKTKYDIKPSDVRNHFGIFVNCLVTNPRFKGQTKEILSTASKDLGCDLTIPEKVLKQIVKSEITSSIMDWVEKKVAADEKAEMRKLNKKIGGALPINLLDAKTNKRQEANLYIMEGKSAMSAVRKFRDPQVHGCYPLKGKFMNVLEKTNSEVIQNNEVQELVKSLGLKLGEDAFEMIPESGKKIKLHLNDGTIVVDENEELFIDGKWVLAKKLLNSKTNVIEINLESKQVEGGDVIKRETTLTRGKLPKAENISGLTDDEIAKRLKQAKKANKSKGLF